MLSDIMPQKLMKIRKMDKKEDILIVILVAILIFAIFFNNNPTTTGFVVLEQETNFEDLPKNININQNSQFTLKINKPGYKFSDNTDLFRL